MLDINDYIMFKLTFKKLFQLNNYIYHISNILRCHNFIVNKLARPVSFEEVKKLSLIFGINFTYFDINSNDYSEWVRRFFPELPKGIRDIRFKKLIEFYTTYTMLSPGPDDVFMDVAGGIYTYINKLDCKKKYLQDIRISGDIKSQLGAEIDYIESDAGNIQLPNESVDKISVHHAFEHFQGNSDTLFIKDVQRILKRNGKCCIIPLFIANKFFEVTAAVNFNKKFDSRSKRIIDPTALVPGGASSGNYARFYDIQAFKERVIDIIDSVGFKVTITELKMDGMPVPDLSLDCHRAVTLAECPYKALIIEREG